MPVAYVGVGSNQGRRWAHGRKALEALSHRPGIRVLEVSRVYETAPWGKTDQPNFLNGAAKIRTRLTPKALLRVFQDIERKQGRKRTTRWGPRTLDMDLLFYGPRVIRRPDLAVPHPRMHERRFVLEPMAEIAPGFRHPVLKKTMKRLARELKDPTQKIKPLSVPW